MPFGFLGVLGLPSGFAAVRLPPLGLPVFVVDFLVAVASEDFSGPLFWSDDLTWDAVSGSTCGAAEPGARGACELILEALGFVVDIRMVEFLGMWATPLTWSMVTIG